MAMTLFTQPLVQFEDDNGALLSGGKVYFYEPGTATLKDTYTDQAGGTANANPVILNSRGEAAIWLNGFYKVNVTESDDTQVTGYPVDNVSTGSAATSTTQTEWTSPGDTPTYISATQFSVPGDQSTVYQVNRRIKCTVGASTHYGVITAVAYTTITTVTISLDSGSLTASLSIVDVGILTVTNPSVPESVRKVAAATVAGHATNAGQIQAGALIFGTTGGAADAQTLTLAPALAAYVTGMRIFIKAGFTNATTTPTLEINGLGAQTIKRVDGSALFAGDIKANNLFEILIDGTDFIIQNPIYHDHSALAQGGDLNIAKSMFSAHRNGTDQSIADTTWTKIECGTEEFDVNSDYDKDTNYRFTPTVAGKYVLMGAMFFATVTNAVGECRLAIYKNGTLYKQVKVYLDAADFPDLFISIIADANGSTDFFELYVRHTTGASEDIEGDADATWFMGYGAKL